MLSLEMCQPPHSRRKWHKIFGYIQTIYPDIEAILYDHLPNKNIWQNSYMLDLRICPLLAVFLGWNVYTGNAWKVSHVCGKNAYARWFQPIFLKKICWSKMGRSTLHGNASKKADGKWIIYLSGASFHHLPASVNTGDFSISRTERWIYEPQNP